MNMLPPRECGVNANRRTATTRIQCHHAVRRQRQAVFVFSCQASGCAGARQRPTEGEGNQDTGRIQPPADL